MMTDSATVITSNNLSIAWARAFTTLAAPGARELVPLVVNISGFSGGTPPELPAIRAAVDQRLSASSKLYPAATTAHLVFPENLWMLFRQQGRHAFFRYYLDHVLPWLRRSDRRNAGGTYFSRLISYGAAGVPQLEHIISTRCRGNSRRSALQAVLFDPATDHSDRPYLIFPCLDYVVFSPDAGHGGGLSVTAVYARQYIFDRAYGNYLGLCALGRFVAGELGLRFRQLTCVAGIATLGSGIRPRGKRELAAVLEGSLRQHAVSGPGAAEA